ncbi:DUF1858 domain-containing protein [Thioclava sp. JE_KL1]|nr:DUF1858 domain-containing protein [Thioclava sp. JE_KL1]MPQ96015.1 DUF1858 domain-containing protein [Thioclava sp. JE_KL1]
MSKASWKNPDATLDALMRDWPATIEVFMRHKMLCVGCLVNPFHTIDDACTEYRLDLDDFIAELDEAIAASIETAGPRPGKSAPAGADQ